MLHLFGDLQMSARPACWFLTCLAVIGGSSTIQADAQEATKPLQFRRVYAPLDRARELAKDGTWTVRRDEFERLIQAVNDGALGGRAALKSRLESLVLTATYDPLQHALVEGSGVLTVTHDGDEPTAVQLSSFRMAIEAAWWKDDPESAVRIMLGPDGVLLLQVDRTGEIEIRWSLQGSPIDGTANFDFRAISCPHFELKVQSPTNVNMRSTHGVVARGETVTDSGEATDLNFQRWKLTGPSSGKTTITFEPTAAIEEPLTAEPKMQRTTTYEINRRGFRYASQLNIEVSGETLRSIPLRVDEGLRLTSAYLGDEQIDISAADSNGLHWLHFSEATPDKNVSLRVQGAGSVLQNVQRLPKVTVPQTEWLNETILFEVASPLVLASLKAEGCRQTKYEEVGPALKRYRFDAYEPDYSIAVGTRIPTEQLIASSVVRAHWGRANINADWSTRLLVRDGARFEVRLPIPAGWIVDSVKTEPVDRLESWRVDRQGRQVQIVFKTAVAASKPVTIIGRAYRRSSIGPISQQDFSFGRIPDATESERIISITTDSADELRVSQDHQIDVLVAENLNKERDLGIDPNAFVFRASSSSTASRFVLQPKSPHFSAELVLRTELGKTECTQQWQVKCEPEGAPLTYVDLRFQQPLPDDVQWFLVGEDSAPLVAERMKADDNSELWRIALPRSSLTAFELRSEFSQPYTGRAVISLGRVVNADSQNGVVVLGSREGVSFGVDATGLSATPMAPDANFNDRQTMTFNPTGRASLTLRKQHSAELTATTRIWRHRSETFWGDSLTLHHSEVRLENFGADFITAQLPLHAILNALYVNGSPVMPDREAADSRDIAIRLPSSERFILIEASFSFPAKPLQVWGDVAPPTIRFSSPVSQTEQILWMPPEIEPQRRMIEPSTWGNVAFRLFAATPRGYKPFRAIDLPYISNSETSMDDSATSAILAEVVSQLYKTYTKPTWRDFVRAYRKKSNQSRELPRLFVDQAAFSRWNITPDSALPQLPDALSESAVRQWVNELGLDLIWFSDGLVLTSPTAVRAINISFRYAPTVDREGAMFAKFGVKLQTGLKWLQATNLTNQWPAPTPGMADPEMSSWHCIIHPTNPGGERAFEVVRPYQAVTVEWVVVLLCCGVLLIVGGRQFRGLLVFAGAMAVIALVVPIEWVAVPRSLLWGALAAIGLSFCWRRLLAVRASAVSTVSLLLIGLAMTVAIEPLLGQETEAQNSNVIWPVIFPVDEKGNAAGEYCFPAKIFYDALQKQADEFRTETRDWLFVDAKWLIDLNGRDSGEAEFSPEVVGEFTVITNRPNVKVVAPIDRSVLLLKPDGALLNGEPVDLRSEDAGLSFVVAEKGEYTIRIAFQGLVQSRDNMRGIRYKTPPIPMSSIRVSADTGLDTIQFPESLGVVTIDRETGELIATNGPSSAVAIEWPFVGREIETPKVRQNAWIYVNSRGVRCDYKVSVDIPENISIEELEFDANMPLQLNGNNNTAPISKITSMGGKRVAVKLDQPYTHETVVLNFSLYLKDCPLGSIVLPTLRPVNTELVDEIVAITVDPQFNFAPLNQAVATSTSEFAESWPSGVEPDWAIRSLGAAEISFLVTPAEKIVGVDSTLTALVGNATANLLYTAKINYQEIEQWRLSLDTNGIDSFDTIELLRSGEPVDFTWNVDAENRVSVLAKSAFSGEVELRVSGSAKITNPSRWKLPTIELNDTKINTHRASIFREDDTQVRVIKSTGFELDTTPFQPSGPQRHLGAWRLQDPTQASPALELSVQPNRPVASAEIVFTMSDEGDKWFAEAEFLVTTSRGSLDGILFDAPQWWADRIESVPEAEILVSLSADKDRKIVEIRPNEPVAKEQRFHIRGEVLAAAGRRIQLPQIKLINCEMKEFFVVVPKESANQRLNWRLSSLMPAILPQKFESQHAREAFETFRSESANSQAVLQTIRTISDSPLIRLADVRIDAGQDDAYQGTATFDLSPAGMRTCTIVATEGVTVEQIRIDDRPAIIETINENKIRVSLADEQLPQRIDVLFAGHSTAPGVFVCPRVQQIKTRETLWTVRRGVSQSHRSLVLDNNRKSPNELSLRRYRAACQLVGEAVNATSEKSLGEATAWYMPWMRRLARLRSRLVAERESPEELRTLELEQVDIANRLGLESVRQAAINTFPSKPGVVDLAVQSGAGGALGWAFQGEKSSLQTPVANDAYIPFNGQLLLTALFVGVVTMVLFWLGGQERAVSLLYRWPFAALALLGIAWWLAAFPSVVGIAIVAVAAIGSIRSSWRRTRET